MLKFYPGIYLEGLRKTTKTSVSVAGLRADIWTHVLPNMKQYHDNNIPYQMWWKSVEFF
jgi:hypothetical protein